MQKGTLFLAVVIIMAIAAVGLYIWQNEQDKNKLIATIEELTSDQSGESNASPTPVVLNSLTTQMGSDSARLATGGAALAGYGLITGSLSFPSQEIPEMMVCAEETTSGKEFCTNERVTSDDYQYGLGYSLNVPAGEYFVYAKLPNDPYQAYYSEFVTCGLSVDCPSHKPIPVVVVAGETLENIDPQDWYNQQPNS